MNAQTTKALTLRKRKPSHADYHLHSLIKTCNLRSSGTGLQTHRQGGELDLILYPRNIPWYTPALHAAFTGGPTPSHWSTTQTELYAILAYLRKLQQSPGTNADKRALIISDCKNGLSRIESAYRVRFNLD